MPWADLAAAVSPARQPGGDIAKAIRAGFTFGSEPLLVYKDYNAQAFIGPDQWNPPTGVDVDSRDIRLVETVVPGAGPALTIVATGNSVSVRWPVSAAGFVLETAPGLGSGALENELFHFGDRDNLIGPHDAQAGR